ncbi:MAG TPA: BadF/BadG/BcrA/BcrD ATPase family protein [Bryobacteraceae bacterium]|nr:BadF/BadG/BcrA/BcrD ATPase family protein [Bryobacteraceae bacterium]
MADYFLGVDGGQSSTFALIGDGHGRVLGAGRGGPSNHVAAPEAPAKFTGAIRECLSAACGSAGLDAAAIRFRASCLGFSGGPADKEAILREILASERIVVTHDALIALSGATGGDPGIITIAGTGSIVFGRNASGKTARAGGWGYVFGDEGSGFDIARRALQASLKLEEGWGAETSLRPILLDETGAVDVNDLLHRFYTPEFPRPRIAALAELVDQAAEQDDAVARQILDDAARDLARLCTAVRAQLFGDSDPVRIAYIGGVFRSRTVRERFIELTGGRTGPPIFGPAAGALLEAYRAAGVSCTLTNAPPEKPC